MMYTGGAVDVILAASLKGEITLESAAVSARHILTEHPSAADGRVVATGVRD